MLLERSLTAVALLAAASGLVGGLLLGHTEPAAEAGTALRLDTPGLVERAERIVEGRVLDATTVERQDGSLDTEYRLQVERSFLGAQPGELSVRLPGGTRSDGSGLVLPGLPRLIPGEDVLLFLGAEEHGRALPVGLSQGRYTLLTDRDGVRRAVTSGAATLVTGSRRGEGRLSVARSYAELAAEVEAAVNARVAASEAGDVR